MKTIVIANPISGSFNRTKFENCLKILKYTFTDMRVFFTEYQSHAEEIAYSKDYDVVITAGGDGIINEVINGIEKRKDKNKPILFYSLPFGTSNVFCREYNIPLKPELAVKKMNISEFDSIPLGFISGRYFSLMLGAGFDAMAVKNVNFDFKRKFGKFAYIWSGLCTFFSEKFKPFEIYINGKKMTAYHVIISVSNRYAGSFILSKDFKKKYLNVYLLENKSKLLLLKNIISITMFKGFKGKNTTCNILKLSGIDEFQLDGDYFKFNSKNNFVTLKKSSFFLLKSL